MTRYGVPYRTESGCWWITEFGEGGYVVLVRLNGREDASYGEHNTYDPKCAPCWLGHAHSGDYHRRALGVAV